MKKLKNIAIALMLVICASVALVACGATNVAGKTYAYEKTATKVETLTEAQIEKIGGQTVYDEYKKLGTEPEETMKGTKIEFKKDGTVVATMEGAEGEANTVYYSQDGKSIKLYEDKEKTKAVEEMGEFKVNGKTVTATMTVKYSMLSRTEVAEADDFVIFTTTVTFKQA